MKIDSQELQTLAAVEAILPSPPRADLYATIHKAARALMADTLVAVGRVDSDDALELAQVGDRVMQLLDFCRSHLRHENEFIHPAIEAAAQGGSARIAGEHVDHLQDLERLARAVTGLLSCEPAQRAAQTHALYQQLALFTAYNFEHMHIEETAHNALLWARYSDAELMALHGALVASIPPEDMMFVLRWMVPFMSPAERAGMLGEMQQQAPAPVFDAVIRGVVQHLTHKEWVKLAGALGLPLVPGWVTV